MDYNKQAQDFLNSTKTTIEVVEIGKLKPENWDSRPVKTLSVTLKNERHTYNFKFYCSLVDTYGPDLDWRHTSQYDPKYYAALKKWRKEQSEKRKNNYAYDVLACLFVDYSEDFEDFCSNFGYDTDSRKALDVYLAVRNETKNLKCLFTEDQLDLLHEIC